MVTDVSGLRLPSQEVALEEKRGVDALGVHAAGQHAEAAGLFTVDRIGVGGQGKPLGGNLVEAGGVQVGLEEGPQGNSNPTGGVGLVPLLQQPGDRKRDRPVAHHDEVAQVPGETILLRLLYDITHPDTLLFAAKVPGSQHRERTKKKPAPETDTGYETKQSILMNTSSINFFLYPREMNRQFEY